MTFLCADVDVITLDILAGKTEFPKDSVSFSALLGLLPVLFIRRQGCVHLMKHPGHRMILEKRRRFTRNALRTAQRNSVPLRDVMDVVPVRNLVDAFTKRRNEGNETTEPDKQEPRKRQRSVQGKAIGHRAESSASSTGVQRAL